MNHIDNDQIREVYKRKLLHTEPIVKDDDIQLQYILKYLPVEKSIAILDAGCGNGKYAFRLSKAGYEHIDAIDLFDDLGPTSFTYTKTSIDKTPFRDGVFDFIYANSVIYYLDDPDTGIQEFSRISKIGGILILSGHTRYSVFTLIRKCKLFLHMRSVEHLRGVRFRDASYYEERLRRHGYDILARDGFLLSAILYPIYFYGALVLRKYGNVHLPLLRDKITTNRVLGHVRSIFAYHFILVARKTRGPD